MKNSALMKNCLYLPVAILAMLMLSGCQKDDDTTGALKVNLLIPLSDKRPESSIRMYIYPLYAPETVIYSGNGGIKINLNPGEYVVKQEADYILFAKTPFQVIAGKTTEITYNLSTGVGQITKSPN